MAAILKLAMRSRADGAVMRLLLFSDDFMCKKMGEVRSNIARLF